MKRAKMIFDFNHIDGNIDKNQLIEIESHTNFIMKNFGYSGEHTNISND